MMTVDCSGSSDVCVCVCVCALGVFFPARLTKQITNSGVCGLGRNAVFLFLFCSVGVLGFVRDVPEIRGEGGGAGRCGVVFWVWVFWLGCMWVLEVRDVM